MHILYCIGILTFYFFSEDDAFWIAFLFVISDPPGMLFNVNDVGHNFRILTIGTRWIEFYEFFFLTLFLKIIVKSPRKVNHFYMRPLVPVLVMVVVLFLYGLYDGMDGSKILKVIRSVFPFLLIFFVPRFFKTIERYRELFRYLSVFVFFVFFVQVLELLSGQIFASHFGGIVHDNLGIDDEEAARQVYSVFVILLATYGILHLELLNRPVLSTSFDNLVIITGLISITINATRGYWLGLILMVVGYFFIRKSRNIIQGFKIILFFSFLILVIGLVPRLQEQFNKASLRLSTLSALARGDETADGTLSRLTERAPRVLNQFYKRPVLGWGFSNTFFDYADVHVANPTILLEGGVIGYFIWLFFWLNYIFKNIVAYRQLDNTNPWRKSMLVNIIGFSCFLLIGSTSTTVFTYLVGYNAFYLAILFGIAGYTMKEAYYYHRVSKR